MADYPWIASYPYPVRWDAKIVTGPVHGVLDEAAAAFPDRPAVEFMGKRATYRQLQSLADRAAAGFQKLGVGPGVHVGLYLPNTPHYLIAFFGVLKAGGTVVNYSPLDAEKVLEHKVEDSETSMIVTLDLPVLLPQMESLLHKTGLKRLIVGGMADMAGFPECRGPNTCTATSGTCPSPSCSTTTVATGTTTSAIPPKPSRFCSTPAERRACLRARC